MKNHLAATYPLEGCGILAGDESGSIKEVFTAGNTSTEERSAAYYEIDPLMLYELEKKAEAKGYSILGFYHSHPDCEARISTEDKQQMVPQMLYVIASVQKGIVGEIIGYTKDL